MLRRSAMNSEEQQDDAIEQEERWVSDDPRPMRDVYINRPKILRDMKRRERNPIHSREQRPL